MKKTANCKTCGPRALFEKAYKYDYEADTGRTVWECCNCGETKEIGTPRKSKKAQQRVIENIKKSIAGAGSDAHPYEIDSFDITESEDGSLVVVFRILQGRGTMLEVCTSRLIGLIIGVAGSVKVYSDSQPMFGKGTKKNLQKTASNLKSGLHWF